MEPEEPGDQGENQRPSLLDYLVMVFCLGSIVGLIGLVSWGTASLLHSLIHLPMWLGVSIGLAVSVWVVFAVKFADNNTLMELSITCAILAVLFAILIPGFNGARQKARMLQEKQNRSAISGAL